MLRLPSLKNLTYGIEQVIRRFPLVVLVAALKAVMLYILVESPPQSPNEPLYIRLTLMLFLALPLFLSLHLVAERRQWSLITLAAGTLGVTALLGVYFFIISPDPLQRDYYRFGMFLACAHLLVSFAPFVGYDEPNGFWQFNKTMLLQFLTATLYAGTLYIGIVIAVETVRFLFDVSYSIKIELDLFVWIGGFFHTLFFLNGFPANLETLEAQKGYSAGVKLFTQYVLLPLEVVYLLILYIYSAKILIQWQLPQGGVAYLVMAFSVAGIFALLLLYPIRDSAEERWIRIFTRRFHLALFPLIVLLGVAIFRRISEYGVTENRYLVAALAVWLTGITFYFLFSRKDDIRWIPLSLCVASFLLAVGPWSIFSYSRQNQAKRFENLLEKYRLLSEEGKLTDSQATVAPTDTDRFISGIRYFRDRQEINTLRPFFSSVPTGKDQNTIASLMEKQLRDVINTPAQLDANKTSIKRSTLYTSVSFSLAESENIYGADIKGFDQLFVFQLFGESERKEGLWKLAAEKSGALLIVTKNNKPIATFDIAKRMTQIEQKYGNSVWGIERELLTMEHPNARIVLKNISRNEEDYSYDGVLMVKE